MSSQPSDLQRGRIANPYLRLWRRVRRLSRELLADKVTFIAFLYLVVLVAASLFADQVAPYDPHRQDVWMRLLPPGTPGHLLGTDYLGRDYLSRLIHGGRISLSIGVGAVSISMILGLVLGMLAGYYRGITEAIVMRLVDAKFALSSSVLVALMVVMIGPGAITLLLVLGLVSWVLHTRIVRGTILQLREVLFIEAAHAFGASPRRIILTHFLPNIAFVMFSLGVLEVARMMTTEAGLSFLGFGVQPPDISWGLLIAGGREYLNKAWWLVTFPGLLITFTVIAINLLGSWLRGRFNPFQRRLMGR